MYKSKPINIKNVLTLAFIALVINASAMVNAADIEAAFTLRTIKYKGVEYPYQIYIPENYLASEKWPVTLFLHGAGERGNDGIKQASVGLGNAIRANPEQWPTIAIFPQVPAGESWQGGAGKAAMAALDAAIAEFSVDRTRLYLTGLSLGGNGTWYLGFNHPDRFAALVPVCGFIKLDNRLPSFTAKSDNSAYSDVATKIASVPVWIFHGDADRVVPVDESRKMAAALKSTGGNIQYSELPGVRHNAWIKAYANADLPKWMFLQQKNK